MWFRPALLLRKTRILKLHTIYTEIGLKELGSYCYNKDLCGQGLTKKQAHLSLLFQ